MLIHLIACLFVHLFIHLLVRLLGTLKIKLEMLMASVKKMQKTAFGNIRLQNVLVNSTNHLEFFLAQSSVMASSKL